MSERAENLASYVPLLLLRRLAVDPAPPDPTQSPVAERVPAAVMFTDISGYSRITEQLARQGPKGVEALSNLLDVFFGRLIERVRGHGGDVAKFAGDALVAVWTVGEADGGLATAVSRAAACALAVRRTLHDQEIAPGYRLSLRVGLGVGEVVACPVGGRDGRAELFVAGDAVISAARAEQEAPRGGVALSKEVAALLGDRAKLRSQPGGAPLLEALNQQLTLRALAPPPLTTKMTDALRCFVPAVVTARMDGGMAGFEAELRRISVVFVHLQRLGTDDLNLIHRAVVAIQEVLSRYEGSLHHVSVDEKGPALVAAFGLPPRAHSDDPARAAMAALGIRAALGELGVSAALGVSTGEVFCGSVGHERRREYTLVGSAVVRAARLMQAAVAGVLCDEPTWEVAQERVKFESPRSIPMKGQEGTVRVYAPTARRRLTLRQEEAGHALVGRRKEREALRRALGALVEEGQGCVIAIEAEHGFGKSHLVDEAVARARELGLTVLRGAADGVEATTPYFPWRRALAFQLPSGGAAGDSMVLQEGLLLHLSRDTALLDRAPLLDALVPMGLPENEITRQLVGEARAAATRDLILRLIHKMSGGKPLIIALEDVHWMDTASWALCVAAWRRLRPIVLLMTMRPMTEVSPAWQELKRSPGFQLLRLGPLRADEVAALLCQQLDVDRVPRPVLDLVVQRAGGHPQLSLELAYALRDAGVIVVDEGSCRLEAAGRDLGAIELPETVQGLIRSRIDQLPQAAQLVLKVASVIGRVFPLRLLHAIFPTETDKPALRLHLEVLERAAMVAPVAGANEPTWAFKDAITQQVAYNLMLHAQRAPLHRALAERYEDVHPAERAAYTALLAWHWREAGDNEHAARWLERAGALAMDSGAWREAAGFYESLLTLAGEPGYKADPQAWSRWRRSLGLSLVQSGSPARGREELARALGYLGHPPPRSPAGLWLALIGAALRHLLSRVLPAPPLSEAAQAPRLEALRAAETLTEISYLDQQLLPTLYFVFQAVNLAHRLPASAEVARVEANLGLGYAAIPIVPAAHAALRRARQAAERAGPAAQAWVSFVEGQILVASARWDRAEAALQRAVALHRQLGDQRHLGLDLVAVGFMRYHRGQDAQMLSAMDEVERAGERSGDQGFLAAALRGRALVLCRQGRAAEALPLVERALAMGEQEHSLSPEIAARGELAVTLWRAGRRAEALARAREVRLRVGASRPTTVLVLTGYLGVAEVLLEALAESLASPSPDPGLRGEARRALRALSALAEVYPLARPSAGLRLGQLEALLGHPRPAVRLWTRALEDATRLSMPYEAAILHQLLAGHGPPERRAHHAASADNALAELRGFSDEKTMTLQEPPSRHR